MTATRLVLIRHGRTEWNASGRFQGRTDIHLDDLGRAQAAAMAPLVASLAPSTLVSSPLLRARATAEVLGAAAGVAVELDDRLMEIDVGTWSGRTVDEAAAEVPGFHEMLRTGRDFRRSETGETAMEAGARVAEVLRERAAAHPGEITAVIGHGLALRMGILQVLGWDMEQGVALAGLWNCSWSVLERKDAWKLLSYNSVATSVVSGPTASHR